MPQQFTARIYKQGINPCVDGPAEVSQAFGRRGHIPVTGTLNGHPITATLVSKGGGQHRLYINGAMRKQAGVDTGDQGPTRAGDRHAAAQPPGPARAGARAETEPEGQDRFQPAHPIPPEGDPFLCELAQSA